ncbi:MAG: ATP-dependent Clp protease ATP-binding subunit ClpX [Alphaproteobacteria bacterium]|jgi:ATP-dependent Clp protease ATP-binding subunit ClpX|nr:ATP-dependent Clp protease ATP-binding subunit ClpX [Alphaproteobacteria bacterium]
MTEKKDKDKKGRSKKRSAISCSFCGKAQDEVLKIVHGLEGNICSECIYICSALLDETDNIIASMDTKKIDKKIADTFKKLSPQEIYNQLNLHVIGQDKAKKALSVAVYNHYKRIFSKSSSSKGKFKDIDIIKSNILMIGSTGVGKTLLAQTLAKIIDVPFAIADATSLTEAGYVGEDVETILLRLLQAADYDVEKAQRGIIYIDEIDKITRKSDNPSLTRDVSGEGVQQALLKIIEGTTSYVAPQAGRKHPQQEYFPIDTSNILFICGGAFNGLDKVIQQRLSKGSIGFNASIVEENYDKKDNFLQYLTEEDLFRYGLIQEFVGRLSLKVCLDKMTEETIYKILKEPKNAISLQYEKLFFIDGVKLTFKEEAYKAIAKQVFEKQLGARGLRAYLEEILNESMFEIPSQKDSIKEVVIDMDVANKKKKPIYIYK